MLLQNRHVGVQVQDGGGGGGEGILFPNERGNGGDTPSRLLFCIFYVQACKKRGHLSLVKQNHAVTLLSLLRLCVEGPPAFILKDVSFHLSRSKSSSSVRTLRQLRRMNVSSWNRPQTFMMSILATVRFTADIYDPQRLDSTQLGDPLTVPPSHNHLFFFSKGQKHLLSKDEL